MKYVFFFHPFEIETDLIFSLGLRTLHTRPQNMFQMHNLRERPWFRPWLRPWLSPWLLLQLWNIMWRSAAYAAPVPVYYPSEEPHFSPYLGAFGFDIGIVYLLWTFPFAP